MEQENRQLRQDVDIFKKASAFFARVLAPEGARLFHVADSSLQQLQDAIGTLDDSLRHRPVAVTASIGFVGLWLLPRLPGFQQRHPEVEVRLSANNQIVDLRKEGRDIAIRYCAEAAMPSGSSARRFSPWRTRAWDCAVWTARN